MKKNLLTAAALLVSAVASAQTVTWPLTINRESKEAMVKATVEGSTTIETKEVAPGSDLHIQTSDDGATPLTLKDAEATAYNFPSDDTGVIQWQPSTGNYATVDEALTAGCYVDFQLEEGDLNKDLTGLNSIDFYVTKVGTDAVRINCKLLAEGDGEVTSDWLINETNAYTFGDEYNGTTGEKDDPWDEGVNGYNPSRNDGSKGASQGANANGLSHVTLTMPAEVKAVNPYLLTLRIAIAKTANNKGVSFYNVKFNFGTETGISNITSVNSENGAMYNIAGQKVAEDYRGLVIKNGKKFMNK